MDNIKHIGVLIFLGLLASCTGTGGSEDSSSEEFVNISKEDGFSEKHAEPEDLAAAYNGKMITISVEGQENASAYQLVNENETVNYLFVIHEWWGLNEHIKMEADRLFENLENVNVIALDLYDGKVAKTREKAQEYMGSADEARILSIIDAAIAALPANAKIATIGWCFGGGWSLRAALRAGNQSVACVMYYGMPIKDVDKLKKLNSAVLFIYGTQDQWINKDIATAFQENMQDANKNLEVLSFDADHAFANPSGDHYEEDAAQAANEKAIDFLKERL